MEENHRSLVGKVTSLSKEMSALESTVDASNNNFASIAEQVASVKTDTGSLKEKFNSVSNDVSDIQKDACSNDRQVSSLRSDVALLQTSSSSAGQVVDDLEPSVITERKYVFNHARGVVNQQRFPPSQRKGHLVSNKFEFYPREMELTEQPTFLCLHAGSFCQRQRQLIV
ncbi:hypothetical protein RRG08_033804 [Elysia crispata]|uniref:Uncharacterized protein n=1 Tax=Elysia crispata TaxID=231223 RepID=A0AAE1CMD6_9GAST|nr:hypothetical protein RRG08_033804 [Elysia crispata]